MVAQTTVVFCTSEWEIFGRMQTDTGPKQYVQLGAFSHALQFEPDERISNLTGIQGEYLQGKSIQSASIACRMSWAANRKTTRIEDEAYCLLSLFGVNRPLLYGEGRKAFLRLRGEIIKRSDDQSIFAWSLPNPDQERTRILAPDARCSEWSRDVIRDRWCPKSPFVVTIPGLELVMRIQTVSPDIIDPDCDIYIIQLNCLSSRDRSGESVPVEIALVQCNHGYPRVQRSLCKDPRGRGYKVSDQFLKTRQEAKEDQQLYIKLTSQHWDECKSCRCSQSILINEIPSPSARFITPSIPNARRREENARNGER